MAYILPQSRSFGDVLVHTRSEMPHAIQTPSHHHPDEYITVLKGLESTIRTSPPPSITAFIGVVQKELDRLARDHHIPPLQQQQQQQQRQPPTTFSSSPADPQQARRAQDGLSALCDAAGISDRPSTGHDTSEDSTGSGTATRKRTQSESSSAGEAGEPRPAKRTTAQRNTGVGVGGDDETIEGIFERHNSALSSGVLGKDPTLSCVGVYEKVAALLEDEEQGWRDNPRRICHLIVLFGRAFGREGRDLLRETLHQLRHYDARPASAADDGHGHGHGQIAHGPAELAIRAYRLQAAAGANAAVGLAVYNVRLVSFARAFGEMVVAAEHPDSPISRAIVDEGIYSDIDPKGKRPDTRATDYLLWKMEGYKPRATLDLTGRVLRKRLSTTLTASRLMQTLTDELNPGVLLLLGVRPTTFRGWTQLEVRAVAQAFARQFPQCVEHGAWIHENIIQPYMSGASGPSIVDSVYQRWDGGSLDALPRPRSTTLLVEEAGEGESSGDAHGGE